MKVILSNLTRIWRYPGMVLGSGRPGGRAGKLSIVNDPELKLRVIAILDYHSQFALKKIHDNLLNLLRNFKSDRTFSQDPHHD
jgi:hypothetical protein